MGSPRLRRNFAISAALTLLLAALGLAVMGYHPGTEDDGVYLSAVKSNLNPALYPHDAAFFRLQLQATVFDKRQASCAQPACLWPPLPSSGSASRSSR